MNKRCQIAFDKYIEDLNKPKTYNYGSSGGCYTGQFGGQYGRQPGTTYTPPMYNDCTVFFYEWSNLRMGAKHFSKKDEFLKYLDDSKINYTESQKNEIKEAKYKNIFATCVPNKAQLITADTWYHLNTIVESHLKVNETNAHCFH